MMDIDMLKKEIPEYIRVNGKSFRRRIFESDSDTYSIEYVKFDGENWDWKNKLSINKTYKIVNIIPKKIKYVDSDIRDSIEYVLTTEKAIDDFLKELHEIPYEKLNEIVSRSTMFTRELTSLLNKYSKENGSNTPDYILASYLEGCLRVFNYTTKARSEFNGEKLNTEIDIKTIKSDETNQ